MYVFMFIYCLCIFWFFTFNIILPILCSILILWQKVTNLTWYRKYNEPLLHSYDYLKNETIQIRHTSLKFLLEIILSFSFIKGLFLSPSDLNFLFQIRFFLGYLCPHFVFCNFFFISRVLLNYFISMYTVLFTIIDFRNQFCFYCFK